MSFFTRISKTLRKCNMCNKNVRGSIKTTANLYRHVKRYHKTVYLSNKKLGSTDHDNVPYAFKRRSWIWYYFNRTTKNSSQCKLCATIISQTSNNNGNLNRHLKRKHNITENHGKHTSYTASRESNKDSDESDVEELDGTDISSEHVEYLDTTDLASDDGTESELVFVDVKKINNPNFNTWSYFTKISSCLMQCKLCKKDMSFNEDSNEIMYNHIKNDHKLDLSNDNISRKEDIEKLALDDEEMPQSSDFRSQVWKHYNPVTRRCSRCKLCSKKISHGNNIQVNLHRHLKWKHDIQTSQTETDPDLLERPRWSWVWKYFKEVSNSYAQCVICSRKIRHGQTATGNLNRHFMRYHKHEICFEKNVKSLHGSIDKNIKRTEETNISKETQDSCDETEIATKAISELSDEKATESIFEPSTDTEGPTLSTVKLHSEAESATSINISGESKSATEKIMELLEDRADLTKRCRSWVWLYYAAFSTSLAQCKICDSLISHGGRGTGNMARHLNRKHKIENPLEGNVASLTSTETAEPQHATDDNNDWIWPLFENESNDVYRCIICQYRFIKSKDEGKTIEGILEHLRTIHGLLSAEQVVIEDETASTSVENKF